MGKNKSANIYFVDHTIDTYLTHQADILNLKKLSEYNCSMMQCSANNWSKPVEDVLGIPIRAAITIDELPDFLGNKCNNILIKNFKQEQFDEFCKTNKLKKDVNIFIELPITKNADNLIALIEKTTDNEFISGFVFTDDCEFPTEILENHIKKILHHTKHKSVEFMGNNMMGLETANALAVLECGVDAVHTSVGGISICNTAPLEEVIMSAKRFCYFDLPNCTNIATTFEKILVDVNMPPRPSKAIIGQEIFAVESGINASGMFRNTELYEGISPESVGLHRKLVIGKFSGNAAIKGKLSEYGISPEDIPIEKLTAMVREHSIQRKKSLSDDEFLQLVYSIK